MWFLNYAPGVYHQVREQARAQVTEALELTRDLRDLSGETIRKHSRVFPVLRMALAPPLAVDRVVGFARASKTLVGALEEGGTPPRMSASQVREQTDAIAKVLVKLLDRDLFTWLTPGVQLTVAARDRAAVVVADRLCASIANPTIRNAQEARQLDKLRAWLKGRGYSEGRPKRGEKLETMSKGSFAFRLPIRAGRHGEVMIPMDVVVQPHKRRKSGLPLLIEAKSAGDFTNVNKRRKEEGDKMTHLRARYGSAVEYILLLGGYFDAGYLSYEARHGIDWVWEHRLDDLALLKL